MFSKPTQNVLRSVVARQRPFISSPAARLYSSTMHDNDPELLEREKQRNLRKQQHKTSTPHDHAPGWNESLASASEATVKADKSDHGSPEELQARTVEYVKKRHSVSVEDEPTAAAYIKDEITGPLGAKLKDAAKVVVQKTTTTETVIDPKGQ